MPRPEARTALAILAKAPVAGLAKTRLSPALGPDGAAALAERLLAYTVNEALAVGFARLELCVTPDAGHPLLRALARRPGLWVTLQGDGDLGQRLDRALTRLLRGYPAALVIGTDAPALDRAMLRAAADAVARHEAVVVPALDGGYALIGLRCAAPALFRNMPWSTGDLMAATRARAQAEHLDLVELPPVADIDEPADLIHLSDAALELRP